MRFPLWWRTALLSSCLVAGAAPRIQVHGEMGAGGMFPGNTLPAFEYAIDAGVDAIEMDMQVTRDT